MAYDSELADRIREVIASLDVPVTEMKMFGGLAFMIGGNMSVAASGGGGLLLRVPPEETEMLVAEPHAERFVMRGQEMEGWLRVAPEGCVRDDELRRWVKLGVGYAASLPRKGDR